VSVSVTSPTGYNISGSPKTATIYFYTPPFAFTTLTSNIGGFSGRPASDYPNGIIYANGLFVAGGQTSDDKATLVWSGDGITWNAGTGITSGNNSYIYDIAYGDGTFLATGWDSNAVIYTSTDGKAWSGGPLPNTMSYAAGRAP
jgi:hypothetical protein